MKRRTRWMTGLAAVVALLAAATTAVGYTGQVAATITVAVKGTVTCDAPFTMTATIVDLEGAPVAGQSVAWSFETTPSASDAINKTPTTTNAQGVATTTVTLAPVSGTRRIRATAGDFSATAVVDASCGGLPSTSTLPAETPGPAGPLAVMLLVAIGVGGRRRTDAAAPGHREPLRRPAGRARRTRQ